jgi:Gpi18-like mannosyltransferase
LPIVLAILARLALLPFVSGDATFHLLPWMHEFQANGSAALGGNFSNYNFPYLLLLFFSSLLPLEPLFAVKLVSLLGDALLALAVAQLARHFKPSKLTPAAAGIITLFLPTVLLNAAMWGQCDSYYTAFLALSLTQLLENKGRLAWFFWAVALAFKLQAFFFLPVLLLVSVRARFSISNPLLAIAVWTGLSLPPVLFGRSVGSTLSVYVQQTQDGRLASGAASLYVWFPKVTAAEGTLPALALCSAALVLAGISYWRGPDSREQRVLLAVTSVSAAPFLLPQMHDRYFFVAEVLSILLARTMRLQLVPWLLSSTGLAVYILYLTQSKDVWPLLTSSAVQCVAIYLLFRELVRRGIHSTKDAVTGTIP